MYYVYIYEIIDSNNRCHYIGKTDSLRERWMHHKREDLYIDRHMRKYPNCGWSYQVIESFSGINREIITLESFLAEIDWIKFHRFIGSPLKNVANGVPGGSNKKIHNTAQTKFNHSEATKRQHQDPIKKQRHLEAGRTKEARYLKMMNAPKRKQIICINDPINGMKEFNSGREAERYYNISNVCYVCNGKVNSAKGLKFKWKE